MKEDKKPQWLKDAEKELKKFNESKAGQMSDTNIKRSVTATSSRNKYKEENPEEFKQGIENAVSAAKEWHKENPEESFKISSKGGKTTMSGEYADKIQSLGGKASGLINQPKMHAKNLETGHYDRLHSGAIFEKAHNTRKANGHYFKRSEAGNKVLKAKHLKIYHERVAKILPILPDDWFTRKQAEDIYISSKVKEEIKAPLGIIKRILKELEFVEDNGKTLRARRYKKLTK